MQELGLAADYMQREDVRQFCGMLDGLAFLPVPDVQNGVTYIRENVPDVDRIGDLVEYFDATYVSGVLRPVRTRTDRRLVFRLQRSQPLFPPLMWNFHEETLANQERSNNACESWNNGFRALVGHHHPSLWHVIHCLNQDHALAITDLVRVGRGEQLRTTIKRATLQHQQRLLKLCMDRRDGRKTVAEMLRSLGHCIRLIY